MEPEIQRPGNDELIIERPRRSRQSPEKSPPEVVYKQRPMSHHSHSSRKPRWSLTAWSMAASFIDLLLVFAATCFMAVLAMLLLKLHALNLSGSPVNDQVGLALCFVGIYSAYLLVFRVFVGCTIGEWACGLRLGEPRHRLSDDYCLRVLGRYLIVATTGYIILPVLSLFIGQDVAGKLAGLPLVTCPRTPNAANA